MIIAKPKDCRLTYTDIRLNLPDYKYDKYSLCYPRDNKMKKESVYGEENLKNKLEELNNLEIPVLFCADIPVRRSLPVVINSQTAVAYEGLNNFDPKTVKEQLKSIGSLFKNPSSKHILWLYDKLLDYKDCLISLNVENGFSFVKTYSKYGFGPQFKLQISKHDVPSYKYTPSIVTSPNKVEGFGPPEHPKKQNQQGLMHQDFDMSVPPMGI